MTAICTTMYNLWTPLLNWYSSAKNCYFGVKFKLFVILNLLKNVCYYAIFTL